MNVAVEIQRRTARSERSEHRFKSEASERLNEVGV